MTKDEEISRGISFLYS